MRNRLNRSLMLLAAERYAKANISDPFAYARAVAHINNGIAEFRFGKDQAAAYYDAEEDTGEFGQRIWRNVVRP